MSKVITTEHTSEGTRKDGYKITIDLDKCIAAGPCEIAAPLVYLIRDTDGKAIVGDPDADTLEKVLEGARCCPVLAIIIKDKFGKQVFP